MQNPSSSSSSSPPIPLLSGVLNNLRDPKPKPSFLLYTFLFISLLSLALILSLILSSSSSSTSHSGPDPFLYPTRTHRIVYDTHKSTPSPPSLAYLISGSRGHSARILRLLHAAYHPLNTYLLHLDPSAPHADRRRLALAVQAHPVFKAARNVHVVGNPDFAYPRGSSPLSLNLRAASVLLRLSPHWDWFVSLTADAYPLVTQDGMPLDRFFFFFLFLEE
ncbi:hypothetical protein Fmac_024599 [Flemingia macrophylla]|uniref:Uncharacterized protein n=1 Tax=Flemingia macrophylla TaxID=520843 RepID=A0ABD1LPW8_9FABA